LSRITGIGALLVTLVLALACGGGDGSNARTVTGYIDSNTVAMEKAQASDGTYEVWAVYNGSKVQKGTLTAGTAGTDDHVYKIDNLVDGNVYSVVLYKTLGSKTTEVLSTVITASSSTATLAKARMKSAKGRQMNAVTHLVSKKMRASGASSAAGLAAAMKDLGFADGVDLGNIFMDENGSISAVSGTVTIPSVVTVFATAIKYAAVALSSASSETALAAVITATETTITTLTTVAVASTDSSILLTYATTLITSTTTVIASSGVTVSSTLVSTSFTSAVTSVTTATSLDTAAATVATTTSSGTTINVSSFGLAHATYGSSSTSTHTVSSLAPVFKLVTDTAVTGSFDTYATVTVNGVTGSSAHATVSSDDGLTHYILIKKSASATSTTDAELAPGGSYSLTIAAKSGYTLTESATGLTNGTATIKVTDVTLTLPFGETGYTQSQVALNNTYKGISSSTAMFYLNSKTGISYSSSSTGYGIFGSSYAVAATLNGTAVDFSTSGGLISLGTVTESSAGYAKAIPVTVTLSSSGTQELKLSAGSNSLSLEGGSTATLSSLGIPTTLTVTKQ